jgi:hypothetical protein
MCTNSSNKIGAGHRSLTFEITPFVRCLLVVCDQVARRMSVREYEICSKTLMCIILILKGFLLLRTYLISGRPYVSQLLHVPWTVAFGVFEIDCKHKSLELEVCAFWT